MAATLSYQGEASAGSGGTTLTFTVASAAGQERLVALCHIVNAAWNFTTLGSVTIDGQAATQVGPYARASDAVGGGLGTNGAVVSFWRAAGTSATSINVSFSVTAGTIFDSRGAVWTLSGADTLLASNTGALTNPISATSLSVDVNTVAGGAAAGAVLFYSTTTQAVSWTGLTERFQGHNLYGIDQDSYADLTAGSASTPLSAALGFAAGDFSGAAQAVAALTVSFNPAAAGGTTLTAAAGSYAETGASAGLAWGQVSPAGSYALTGSAAGFVVAVGNVVLTAGPGSYNLSGSTAGFPGYEAPPPVQPSTGGGYTGGASRGRMIRKFRKKEDIEEIVERIEEAAALPPPPPRAPPLSAQPPLIDLMPRMQAAGVPAKTRIAVKAAVEDDDDDEAIELLLNLLS